MDEQLRNVGEAEVGFPREVKAEWLVDADCSRACLSFVQEAIKEKIKKRKLKLGWVESGRWRG